MFGVPLSSGVRFRVLVVRDMGSGLLGFRVEVLCGLYMRLEGSYKGFI